MTIDRAKLLPLISYASVTVAVILLALKLWVYLISGSVSILASLVDSLMDALASIINLLAIRLALIPADKNHHFGHGKAESLSALAQAAFIAGSALFLIINAINRLVYPQSLEHTELGLLVMVVSMLLTLVLVMSQRWLLKRVRSQSLRADNLHYVTDFLSNAVVIVALVLVQYGFAYADAGLGLLLGCWIFVSVFSIAKQAVASLMDQALPQEDVDLIQRTALQVAGVLGVHDLRTRDSGSIRFIQLHLELDDSLSLLQAHAIAQQVEQSIKQLFEDSEVIVHQDPQRVVQAK